VLYFFNVFRFTNHLKDYHYVHTSWNNSGCGRPSKGSAKEKHWQGVKDKSFPMIKRNFVGL